MFAAAGSSISSIRFWRASNRDAFEVQIYVNDGSLRYGIGYDTNSGKIFAEKYTNGSWSTLREV